MSSVPRLRLARNALLLLCGHVIGLAPLRLRLALMSLPSLVAGENPSSAAQTSLLMPHFGWRRKKLGHETGQWQSAAKCSTRPTATGRVVTANSDGCDGDHKQCRANDPEPKESASPIHHANLAGLIAPGEAQFFSPYPGALPFNP
jgi:hypothetical protein